MFLRLWKHEKRDFAKIDLRVDHFCFKRQPKSRFPDFQRFLLPKVSKYRYIYVCFALLRFSKKKFATLSFPAEIKLCCDPFLRLGDFRFSDMAQSVTFFALKVCQKSISGRSRPRRGHKRTNILLVLARFRAARNRKSLFYKNFGKKDGSEKYPNTFSQSMVWRPRETGNHIFMIFWEPEIMKKLEMLKCVTFFALKACSECEICEIMKIMISI